MNRPPRLFMEGVRVQRLTKATADKPAKVACVVMGGSFTVEAPGNLWSQLEIGKEYSMVLGGDFKIMTDSFDTRTFAKSLFEPARLEALPAAGEDATPGERRRPAATAQGS